MNPAPAPRRIGVRVLLVVLVALGLSLAAIIRFAYSTDAPGRETSLSQVYQWADGGRIVSATVLDEDAVITGRRCAKGKAGPIPPSGALPGEGPLVCQSDEVAFFASYPRSNVATQQLIERIATTKAPVVVDKQTDKAVAKLLATFLFPLLILATLFGIILLSRGADSSIAEIAGFGRFGRKRSDKADKPGVTFADVAGAEDMVAELREVIDYLRDPKRFEGYGAAAPKGVLLFGPPGCGKTLLARAVAGECGVSFLPASGTEFVESLVGIGAARVRDLFRQAREAAPAILFIDEIDAVGRRREGEGVTGGEREQTLNQLLVELDGFEVTSGVVIIGATNRPDILDPALLRPGRFDRHVTLEPPDVTGRQAILELHAKGKPLSPSVDFAAVARRTPGFTGADLANVINEAALLAIREDKGATIDAQHVSEAILRVLHGPQRRGRLMTPDERRRIAIHEGGHAVVAASLNEGDGSVRRVSIVARGVASLGQSLVDDRDRALLTGAEMGAQLIAATAGIAAERVVFSDTSTTAEDDITRANRIAREMVGRYGMSGRLGLLKVLGRSGAFLGDSLTFEAVSAQTMIEFDYEVKALTATAVAAAAEIIAAHVSQLHALADALEEHETLEGEALEELLAPVRRLDATFVTARFSAATGNGNSSTPPAAKATRVTKVTKARDGSRD